MTSGGFNAGEDTYYFANENACNCSMDASMLGNILTSVDKQTGVFQVKAGRHGLFVNNTQSTHTYTIMHFCLQSLFRIVLFFVLITGVMGCNHSVDDIEIVRNPTITIAINGTNWQPSQIIVAGFGKELVTDSTQQGPLYFGYSMVLVGSNENRLSRKITIRFAVPTQDELRGRYTTQLSERGAISRIEVLDQVSAQEYELYQLAPDDSTSFLEIDRQSTENRLIAGTFAFTVVSQDSTRQISADNGSFKDISYQKWQNSNL